MGILTARDLLYHVPRRYDDASTITPLSRVEVGMDVTAVGVVRNKGVVPTRSGLRIFQVVIRDDTGIVTCAWPGQPWLDRTLRVGDRILVTGPVKFFHGRQIQPREHTLLERPPAAADPSRATPGPHTPIPDPHTPNTNPLPNPPSVPLPTPARHDLRVLSRIRGTSPSGSFRRLIAQNLEWLLRHVRDEEHLPAPARDALGLPELTAALHAVHRPRSLDRAATARRRLAFDELFLLQLLQARVRYRATRERPGIVFERSNRLIRALHDSLPFTLTGAQVRVLREIYADMASPRRMNRHAAGRRGLRGRRWWRSSRCCWRPRAGTRPRSWRQRRSSPNSTPRAFANSWPGCPWAWNSSWARRRGGSAKRRGDGWPGARPGWLWAPTH